jgi:very-short-patch-repair endonuclease
MSFRDYIVKTQYDNKPPKCKCGFCDLEPEFYRKDFKNYAFGHNKFEWYKENYISSYGYPVCVVCGKQSGFRRKTANRYCSPKCSGKIYGFSDSKTQQIIRNNVMIKYGVDSVSKLDSVREKIAKSKTGKPFILRFTSAEEWKKHIGEGSARKWADPAYREKTSASIKKSSNTPEQRAKRSSRQKERWKDLELREAMLLGLLSVSKKFSKLHQRIRKELNLGELGFISEQRIDRYLIDELNETKKIAIEINGNYVHANPLLYEAKYIIRLPGNSYTAEEKWESDLIKKTNLENLGYKVITIWETDDLEIHKQMLGEN